MIRAMIFDLDGTLVNSLPTIAFFANQALQKYKLPPIEEEKYQYLIGDGEDLLVRRMLKTVGDEREELFVKVKKNYHDNYDTQYLYLTSPYQGILELIANIKRLDIQIGVLSNKPDSTTQKIVMELFPNRIDLCYGKRENFARKPDPAGLLEMIAKLGVNKEECLYIGDTSTDMKTGRNAGVFTIGVTWGFRDRKELEEYQANLIVETPDELFDALKNHQSI